MQVKKVYSVLLVMLGLLASVIAVKASSVNVEANPIAALQETAEFTVTEYDVPAGSHPHDVAPAVDGGVWFTAQAREYLGWLNPETGEIKQIPLGQGSQPHGVILGPDGAPWITDGGLNAIVRVDPATEKLTIYPLPKEAPYANLNTAAFDSNGVLWFTGQAGYYGSVDPKTREVRAFKAPRGPYGITTTSDGKVYYASLAGSHIAEINTETGEATIIEPPTQNQGARRVWSDSKGRIWVSEWNAGQVSVYDPTSKEWQQWKLPGNNPQTYAVFVDDQDIVWLTDFGGNAVVRFAPTTEEFTTFEMKQGNSTIRQLNGRPGEVWGAESGLDKLVVIRTMPGK
jgi:virginiamycin B lyase